MQGRQRVPHAPPRHPAARARPARRPLRCGRRARREDRRRRRDGLLAHLQREPHRPARGFTKIQKIKGTCGDHTALQNNATAGLYPPGSTFKMVTAAAALDSGAYTPSSPFYDPGYCIEYGKRVSNASNPDQNGPEAFGNVSLAAGLRALDQLGLLQRRDAHRRPEDPRLREALRLLLGAAARDAARREPRLRSLQARGSSSRPRATGRSTRAGSRSARSGCS